jgi:hypothetical protein
MIEFIGTAMEEGVKTIPDIIKASAGSPLGIFALMIICLSLLAFAFLWPPGRLIHREYRKCEGQFLEQTEHHFRVLQAAFRPDLAFLFFASPNGVSGTSIVIGTYEINDFNQSRGILPVLLVSFTLI